MQSYSCPLLSEWSVQVTYVWQTNHVLFATNGIAAYTPLVQCALTYVANFTAWKYVTLISMLGDVFGLYLRGSSACCVYGFYSPSSQWV